MKGVQKRKTKRRTVTGKRGDSKRKTAIYRLPEHMKREIVAISLFFMIFLIMISLLSYNPADPSIHNARATGHIHNLFGLVGSNIAGLLIGLFGLGAFWFPVILLFVIFHFNAGHNSREIITTVAGGAILILTSGSLLALRQDHYMIFGSKITSGGIIGIPLKEFLVEYTNVTGGAVILALTWNVGFILATGISVITFSKYLWGKAGFTLKRAETLYIIWKERRERAKKRTIIIKDRILPDRTPPDEEEVKKDKPLSLPKALIPRRPSTSPFMKKQKPLTYKPPKNGFQLPPLEYLEKADARPDSMDDESLQSQSRLLEKKLEDYGVLGEVVAVTPGPVITTFEYKPAPGIKINRVVNLSDDLALALRAISIRIVAPIPGRAVIGIEIPNKIRETVKMKEIIDSGNFKKSKSKLSLCLGKDIVGRPVVAELDKMPHLLIAGATGTGKSVGLNAMICSFLYKSNPKEIKMIMVDPKRIELSMYDGIPHLITPVVTDVKKATNALFWAVGEMEKRYELLSEKKVRNIGQYNRKIDKEIQDGKKDSEKLPFIVIIIDELADLMMVASRDVEVALTRLAQMARAAGLHLILATQRPSVNVLTGIIKANFPTRLTYQVSSKIDSRTILDTNGAESLLGDGDMLFMPPGTSKLQRIHGPYISEEELIKVVEYLKQQETPDYDTSVVAAPVKEKTGDEEEEYDERYDDAVAFVTKTGKASISMVQRQLRIGYNRAARIIEVMEREGVVGPSDGAKPREVLVRGYDDD